MADHMMEHFGPGTSLGSGTEEIELALVKLYGCQREKYLDFAYWLLEERGRDTAQWVTKAPGIPLSDEMPVRELSTIRTRRAPCIFLWHGCYRLYPCPGPAVGRCSALKMYITGIGSRHNEGLPNSDLPNYEAYCETCASVGMVL